jgi:hypothetical protein
MKEVCIFMDDINQCICEFCFGVLSTKLPTKEIVFRGYKKTLKTKN